MMQALPDGILNNLVTMINFMKEGEFVKANDIYLLTAIGNAPWPIGLTMVGIHERSGMHGYFGNTPIHVCFSVGYACACACIFLRRDKQRLRNRKNPFFCQDKIAIDVVTGYTSK